MALARTLLTQFNLRTNYYATKTIWFCEDIFKRGIKLLKTDTFEQLGELLMKGLKISTFEYMT